jgi:hypothetical protein
LNETRIVPRKLAVGREQPRSPARKRARPERARCMTPLSPGCFVRR